jgi:hypothetical protein
MDYSAQTVLRRSKRKAYLLGLAHGRRPPTHRAALIEQTRRLFDRLPLFHQHAVLCQKAIDVGADAMVHTASALLGAVIVLARRMPTLQRALFVSQIFNEARTLLGTTDEDIDNVETLH